MQFCLHSGVQVHEQRNVYIGAPRWTYGKVQRFPCPILSPGAPCRRELNTASPRRRKITRKTCPLNSRQVQVLFEIQSSSLLCIFFAETSQRLALEKLMVYIGALRVTLQILRALLNRESEIVGLFTCHCWKERPRNFSLVPLPSFLK